MLVVNNHLRNIFRYLLCKVFEILKLLSLRNTRYIIFIYSFDLGFYKNNFFNLNVI